MRQAILTKYLPPTNHRGARIRVKAFAGTRYYPWDDALDVAENHTEAALVFAKEFSWLIKDHFVGGSMPDNTGYCFVFFSGKEV